MSVESKYLDIPLEGVSVRNSQKRLKQLISDLAVSPLERYQEELTDEFITVEEILMKRIATIIAYWCQHKHDPIKPNLTDMMSDITNSTKNDSTLEEFYLGQVKDALHTLAPIFNFDVPDGYIAKTDELEFALLELEEKFDYQAHNTGSTNDDDDDDYDDDDYDEADTDEADDAAYDTYAYGNGRYSVYDDYDEYANYQDNYADYEADDDYTNDGDNGRRKDRDSKKRDKKQRHKEKVASPFANLTLSDNDDDDVPDLSGRNDGNSSYEAHEGDLTGNLAALADIAKEDAPITRTEPKPKRVASPQRAAAQQAIAEPEQEKAIVATEQAQITEVPQKEIHVNVLEITAEQAWQMTYGLMGYESDYIQKTMLPRWQQYPDSFDKDRRFLYRLYVETIQKAAGVQFIAGNFTFIDRQMTVDQLWNYYFMDLSQHIAPQLTAAKFEAAANDPWWKKWWQNTRAELGNISAIWLIALAIALIFDGLTTYISLDQTPMEGFMVIVFTVLITALFQIADQLVINYRKREFEAEAMVAKYQAQLEQYSQALDGLQISSDSYVQLSMKKSQSNADWRAAEDNRKMARRGRFWSARIADINVIVTAYGFAYMFLNSEEPVYALIQQVDYIFIKGQWETVDLWVFLMIGLAVTVSFVVNTAQRTEILGWSMRRLKTQA